jgi:hypothetical protein
MFERIVANYCGKINKNLADKTKNYKKNAEIPIFYRIFAS